MQKLNLGDWSQFQLDFKKCFDTRKDWSSLGSGCLTYIASCNAAIQLSLSETGCLLNIFDLQIPEDIKSSKYCLKCSLPLKEALDLFFEASCLKSFKVRDVIIFLHKATELEPSVIMNGICVSKEKLEICELFNPFVSPSTPPVSLNLNPDQIFKG